MSDLLEALQQLRDAYEEYTSSMPADDVRSYLIYLCNFAPGHLREADIDLVIPAIDARLGHHTSIDSLNGFSSGGGYALGMPVAGRGQRIQMRLAFLDTWIEELKNGSTTRNPTIRPGIIESFR